MPTELQRKTGTEDRVIDPPVRIPHDLWCGIRILDGSKRRESVSSVESTLPPERVRGRDVPGREGSERILHLPVK
jgi:hypothetical protein